MNNHPFIKPWIRRFSFRGFSIQQRLPLLICVLLLGIIVTFGGISYLSVRKASIRTGSDRLLSLSDQLGNMLGQSAQSLIQTTRGIAANESIQQYLLSEETESVDAVYQLIQQIQQTDNSVLVEVANRSKRPVLEAGKKIIVDGEYDELLKNHDRPDSGTVGKIVHLGDSIYFPVIATVQQGEELLGYVIRWRRMNNTPKALEQLSQLLGAHSTFYVGNADNSNWTDMIKPIDDPLPQNAKQKNGVYEYSNSADKKVFAAIQPIHNTPWNILIEFSQDDILSPAKSFLRWVVIIGAILVCIGIFFAWMMSRNITRPLNRLTAAAPEIVNTKYTITADLGRRDEVGKLARAFNAMATKVSNAQQALEQKVVEAEEKNTQLRNLSAHLQNIREEERMHIAREMHDELGQFLTAMKMDIGWLNKKLSTEPGYADNVEKLTEMTTLIDEAVIFVRKLAAELRPSILDDLGLIPALEWHSREFERRFVIPVHFTSTIKDIRSTDQVATGLFRMYQESLTNVARHAAAKHVTAVLETNDGFIQLSITDDGKGFDTGAGERKTLGLLGMKERALMIGGKFEIQSYPGKGTTILISVPISTPATKESLINVTH